FLIWLSKKSEYQGEICAWYLILYSIGRFFAEYLRGDLIRGHAGIFSTSQWISLLILAAGICMMILIRKNSDNKPA
ncbi:MAG: prolipoprotein diacylglyceryl transferase, partial [Erysipelotrichaceae bacterium]|nr:prolipoprotein diacylglyceryl transferase [Erysipelotrichaceae bacterium]